MSDGIKQIAKGRWSVRVKRVDAATGRVCNRKATVLGSKADAVRKRDELRDELATLRRGRVRLDGYATDWLKRRASTLKPSTQRKYFYALTHIVPVLGELYVDVIAPADVERYLADRLRVAAGNTVLNELRLLRTLARDALAESYTRRYWCERVKAPRVARYSADNPNLLTPDQAVRVLELVPARWLGLVLFIVTTGLRFGEASALRWEDVKNGVAIIRRGNYRGLEITPKTLTSYRTVPVLAEVLELWGMRRDRGLVFPSRDGKLHRGSPLRAVLAKACATAGVPRITTHGLRRTFNNEGRQRGSREVLKSITGHGTDEMVEHYSMVADGEKAELARAVARVLGVLKVSGDRTPKGGKS